MDQTAVCTVLVAAADDACRRGDLAALAAVVRHLIARAPHALRFEVVAIAELAALVEPLALDRWRQVTRQLATAA